MTHTTAWLNLESLVSLKEARHDRPHIEWFHFYEMTQRGKSMETESRAVVTRDWGDRMRNDCLWGGGIISCVDENVLTLVLGLVAQVCECTKNHWIVYFKWENCVIYYLNKVVYKKKQQKTKNNLEILTWFFFNIYLFIYLFIYYWFIYLVVPGLSCSTQDL